MQVIIYGEAHACARAERGPDFVRLYDEAGGLVLSHAGIRDFAGYVLEGGEWTEVGAEPVVSEQLATLLGESRLHSAQIAAQADQYEFLEDVVAEVIQRVVP